MKIKSTVNILATSSVNISLNNHKTTNIQLTFFQQEEIK